MQARCASCQGTGFRLQTREDGALAARPCECQLVDLGRGLLGAARIPPRYDHCSFDTFEAGHDPSLAPALHKARQWVELWPAVSGGLLLVGPPGTGKTHLAVAIARELIGVKNARVVYYEQRELLKALQGTYDAASPQRESEVLGPALGADVLVLDDLGAGRTTEWARDVMHDIIAQRYNDVKPLIMTSNRTLEDEVSAGRGRRKALDAPLTLRDRLGDALMSRLYEMCEIVHVSGKDYRIGVRRHSGGP